MLSKKPWNFSQVLLLLLGVFLCICLVSMIAQAAGVKSGDTTALSLVMGTLSLDGSILIAVWVFLVLNRISWAGAFGFGTPGQARAILLGLVAGILFVPIGDWLKGFSALALEKMFHSAPHEQLAVETIRNSAPGLARMSLILLAALLAPVAEEMLFRGILYPTIKQYHFPRTAVWSTSILFGLIHFDLASLIPLIILAVGLIVLYEKTNNLLACITAHAAFNTSNVILFLWVQHQQQNGPGWIHG